MTTTNSQLREQLQQACDGLLLISESDYPFEVFLWEASGSMVITPETILQKTGHPVDTPAEVVDIESFFAVATTEQEWHNPEERETVKKFQMLVETLKSHLSDIQVYRLGERSIDVYIAGKTSEGDLAGLSTKVVET
jgi:hypothetical protein